MVFTNIPNAMVDVSKGLGVTRRLKSFKNTCIDKPIHGLPHLQIYIFIFNVDGLALVVCM